MNTRPQPPLLSDVLSSPLEIAEGFYRNFCACNHCSPLFDFSLYHLRADYIREAGESAMFHALYGNSDNDYATPPQIFLEGRYAGGRGSGHASGQEAGVGDSL